MSGWTRPVLVAGALFLIGVDARADGAYFTGGEFTEAAQTTHQQAILVYEPDSTTLILQTGYAGDGASFSWVIPAARRIAAGDVEVREPELFDEMHRITAPQLVRFVPGCYAIGCAGEDASTDSDSTVTVYDAFRVDNYDITVVGAEVAADLLTWLDTNGYEVPGGAGEVIDDYIGRGFDFVAVRFEGARPEGGGGGADGGTSSPARAKPLAIRFPGEVTTFPLLISSLSTKREVEILLYTVATRRYEVVNYPEVDIRLTESFEQDESFFSDWYHERLRAKLHAAGRAAFGVEYADKVGAGLLHAIDERLTEQNLIVTRFHGFIDPESMDRDIELGRAAGDKAGERLRVRIVYGGKVETAVMLLPWDLVLLLLLGLTALHKARRRTP